MTQSNIRIIFEINFITLKSTFWANHFDSWGSIREHVFPCRGEREKTNKKRWRKKGKKTFNTRTSVLFNLFQLFSNLKFKFFSQNFFWSCRWRNFFPQLIKNVRIEKWLLIILFNLMFSSTQFWFDLKACSFFHAIPLLKTYEKKIVASKKSQD